MKKIPTFDYHRFLDEAGDTTFFGKGSIPMINTNGVSKSFIIGMLKLKEDLQQTREKILRLQEDIISDDYLRTVPSIQKKINKNAFFLHATDDIPEVREKFFKFIKNVNCSFEAVVGRKIYSVFNNKHNNNEVEFYADLLSHLIKNKFSKYDKLVLNIANRGQSTSNTNLNLALDKAVSRNKSDSKMAEIVFNVQTPLTDPILNIADYLCWSIQRVFERGDTRYYDFIQEKISLVVDLYDFQNYDSNRNYYNKINKLTKSNRI